MIAGQREFVVKHQHRNLFRGAEIAARLRRPGIRATRIKAALVAFRIAETRGRVLARGGLGRVKRRAKRAKQMRAVKRAVIRAVADD